MADDDAPVPVPPEDRYHLVYLAAVLFGTAMLFPYNAFISTPSYENSYYTFASGNANYTTTMPAVWENIENYLMVCSLVPNFLGQVALMTPMGRKIPLFGRFTVSLVVMVACVLAVVVVPVMRVDEQVALATLLLSTIFTNLAAAVFQASIFSFAAFFPFAITQGVMLGIGVSGSLASLLAIVIKASMSDSFESQQQQAQIYFGIAIAMLAASFCALFAVRRNPYTLHFVSDWRHDAEEKIRAEDRKQAALESGGVQEVLPLVGKRANAMESVHALKVVRKVWPMILSVFWVFFISLVVFPSFGIKFHPKDSWFGFVIVLMFNIGDFSGRFLCRFEMFHIPDRHIVIGGCAMPTILVRFLCRFKPLHIRGRRIVIGGCAMRTILILFFFLCIKPPVINSIPFEYILMYITGVTNGYFGSHCMMMAPGTPELEGEGERGIAGNAMSVGLLAGAAGGSLISLAIVPAL